MRLGTQNVRSLYRPGSLTRAVRETAKYRLHFVGVQKVKWDRSGTQPAGEYTFCVERVIRIMK
jgi:hypothetical protein